MSFVNKIRFLSIFCIFCIFDILHILYSLSVEWDAMRNDEFKEELKLGSRGVLKTLAFRELEGLKSIMMVLSSPDVAQAGKTIQQIVVYQCVCTPVKILFRLRLQNFVPGLQTH